MSVDSSLTTTDSSYLKQLEENVKKSFKGKPNCKLCNSPNRIEAEKMYDDNKSLLSIHKFLESQGESYQYKSVCNHFSEHYERQQTDFMIAEYISHLTKMRVNQVIDLDRLETRRDMFEKSLITLAAKNDTTKDVSEIRRNASALKILNDSIISIESLINEIKKESEPVVIVLKTLQVLINESIKDTDSQDVKNALVKLLEDFEERVDGLFAE